jgi:hypothetical protein
MIGVIDTYGIELIHPRREGRSAKQIERTMALFNLSVSWPGLQPDDNGLVRLSIAAFSL